MFDRGDNEFQVGDVVIVDDIEDTRQNTNYARFIGRTGTVTNPYAGEGEHTNRIVKVAFADEGSSMYYWRLSLYRRDHVWEV